MLTNCKKPLQMKNTQYIVYNIAVSEITSYSMNYTIDLLLTVLLDS